MDRLESDRRRLRALMASSEVAKESSAVMLDIKDADLLSDHWSEPTRLLELDLWDIRGRIEDRGTL